MNDLYVGDGKRHFYKELQEAEKWKEYQEQEKARKMNGYISKKKEKNRMKYNDMDSASWVVFLAFVVVIIVGTEYLLSLLACGIWNHMIVPVFHFTGTITLFQGFGAAFVVQFIGCLLNRENSSKE